MIVTLAWKELREHRAIWLTMVVMTIVLGLGLVQIVTPGDRNSGVIVGALTILGMAATYGVVCGSMMFAGEREGGTLIFLDIYHGKRGRLWLGKVAIGAVLVVTEAVAVALVLRWLQQEAPSWGLVLVGQRATGLGRIFGHHDPTAWLLILPVVTLEAYAWGLFGSSLTERVLAGAAVAAGGAAFLWLLALGVPSAVFFPFRIAAALLVLLLSCAFFLTQARERPLAAAPEPAERPDPKSEFLKVWEAFERGEGRPRPQPEANPTRAQDSMSSTAVLSETVIPSRLETPTEPPILLAFADEPAAPARDPRVDAASEPLELSGPEGGQARSEREVLWWLALQQAWPVIATLAVAGLLFAILIPANGQVLWPLATLLLGVACGTAAFAPEQRDLTYQFLAAQHLPLKSIWRFKITFWFAIAILATAYLAGLVMLGGTTAQLVLRPGFRGAVQGIFRGTFPDLLGPVLFFGMWVVYGFITAQVFVWLCRKNILALVLSGMVAAGAIGLWLPSLLCGGMNGWQVWVPPVIMLLATHQLVRAWAGGRIKERQPLKVLAAFTAAAVFWLLLNWGYRAWEVPNVGAPLDPEAYRASLPLGPDNVAAKKILEAVSLVGEPGDPWKAALAQVARLPPGMIETPRADGQMPLLQHMIGCRKMSVQLLAEAEGSPPNVALDRLVSLLALSRNLRFRAPLESYLVGIEMESSALDSLERLPLRGPSAAGFVRRALEELDRHVQATPTPLDCLQTECYRSSGALDYPNVWSFAASDSPKRLRERWLVGGVALSLDMPWETERKTRIWQLAWSGLFRAIEKPYWELPDPMPPPAAAKDAANQLLRPWLAASDGVGAGISREQTTRWLDASWLADERLFPGVLRLRNNATRARWRVEATRQMLALCLYRDREGKTATRLQDLVPRDLPSLPLDPYRGKEFGYRVTAGEMIGDLQAARDDGVLWSAGPDRTDNDGRRQGSRLADDDQLWRAGEGFDLLTLVPTRP